VELGQAQTDRASKLLAAMPQQDRERVDPLLQKAKPNEKKYLQKALASSHSADELDAFYKQIAGKNQAWMDRNLHVVGGSKGKGIKQQWQASCAPTTVEAMKAELDPIYALKLWKENPKLTEANKSDGTAVNPKLAEDQKAMLVAKGGIATNRDTKGTGMKIRDALNEQKAVTGLEFTFRQVDASTVDNVLGKIDAALAGGLPVPVRVSKAGSTGGHFVLIVGEESGSPRVYSIHDPWNGTMVKVSEDAIKAKSFNIAGWNTITDMYEPSVDAPPTGP
jgi:hypothetical protein